MEKMTIFENGLLICIGQEMNRIPGGLCRLYGEQVERLDLSGNQLVSLQGIEKFSNLRELVVDNNALNERILLPNLPKLVTFSINKNKVANLEVFLRKIATSMPQLKYLSLLGNVACPDQLSDCSHDDDDYARYRCYVIHELPNLAFLDSSPVLPSEVSEAKRRGHLLRVAKPVVAGDDSLQGLDQVDNRLTPLPRTRRQIGDHQGAYGKCRYKYSGKHSEGNRFIQNHDL